MKHICSVCAHPSPVIMTFSIITKGCSNMDIICYTGMTILINLVSIYMFLNEILFTASLLLIDTFYLIMQIVSTAHWS